MRDYAPVSHSIHYSLAGNRSNRHRVLACKSGKLGGRTRRVVGLDIACVGSPHTPAAEVTVLVKRKLLFEIGNIVGKPIAALESPCAPAPATHVTSPSLRICLRCSYQTAELRCPYVLLRQTLGCVVIRRLRYASAQGTRAWSQIRFQRQPSAHSRACSLPSPRLRFRRVRYPQMQNRKYLQCSSLKNIRYAMRRTRLQQVPSI